jgi:antitoxin CptB
MADRNDEGGGDDADAVRRRRLKFRCWHRGMKEVDLLLGPFADLTADGLDAPRLAEFEALLEQPDPDILSWVMGEAPVPARHNTPLVRQLLAHYR